MSTNSITGANGGDERVRTDDLLNANQVLSQLSYIPKCLADSVGFEPTEVVEPQGISNPPP